MKSNTVIPHSLFTEFDINLFKSGKHFRLYQKLGSHLTTVKEKAGVYFAVWAPNAKKVAVIGDFNGWNKFLHPLSIRWDQSGIWEGFIPGIKQGDVYKYLIETQDGTLLEKGDPFALSWEQPPRTASVVWQSDYQWKDKNWVDQRPQKQALDQPFSLYEVHMGSWQKNQENGQFLTYRQLAEKLVPYVKEMNFTHIEFMPVMEHPFYGSWGYQIHGYFAPSARFGSPEDFMFLIDQFHKEGIGVILDWVPSHFPGDAHGLYRFDGSALYEHEDPRKGYHPDWSSYIFNYGRNEVRAFLISNAVFWFDQFHADGLRVDAVASMLYLDYSRKEGEWIPNKFGGHENLDAISFMQEMNAEVYQSFPGIHTIAEESTSFPMVSRPTYSGGLGFGMKWMMGWMNDTLEYFKKDPIHRKHHHNELTFSTTYAFTENFMLPLSHDEVVHGKGPIINRMPGDEWQRFANLRLLYGYMFTHPGTKILFMGNEFGQTSEWNHDESLPWDLLQWPPHKGLQALIKDLNLFYKQENALTEKAFEADGFQWIEYNDHNNSVLSFLRKGKNVADNLAVICNFTPTPRTNYRIGMDSSNKWKEVFNTDDKKYWGSGCLNSAELVVENIPWHGQKKSLSLNLPPLGVTILKKI